MKVEKLIKKLQSLPKGIEVCLYDWRRNLNRDCGEGSGEGIYPKFEIAVMSEDEIADDTKPFAVISFENRDYTKEGAKQESED
jgi:hypothetical protein